MDYKQIIKYLEGRISDKEISVIKAWLKNDKNDSESRRILGEIWANSDIRLNGSKSDFDRLLDNLHHKINTSRPENNTNDKKQTQIRSIYRYFSRVAAILLIPLIFVSIFLYFKSPVKNYTSIQEKEM